MKKIILFILLFTLFYSTYGQTFNKVIDDLSQGRKEFLLVKELENENILLTVLSYGILSSELMILDTYGNVLQKKTDSFIISDILEVAPDTIILLAIQGIDSVKTNCKLISINSSLEILSTDSIQINYTRFSRNAKFLKHNNRFYYYCSFFSADMYDSQPKITAGLLSSKGKFISRTDFIIPERPVFDLQGLPNGEVFLNQGGSVMYVFDELFNYKYYYQLPEHDMYKHFDSFWLNNTTLVNGASSYVENQTLLKIRTLDTAFNILNSYIFESENEYDYAGIFSNLARTSDGFIFVGTKNSNWIGEPIDTMNSSIYAVKLDTNLNIQWEKTIGGDAYYQVYSVSPASKDGCLILASRYDEEINGIENDVFLIKMNSEGGYSFISLPVSREKKITVYPNPGNNYINLSIQSFQNNLVFNLYSVSGFRLLSSINLLKITQINTSHLAAGIYFYEVKQQDKIIAKGKWVKQ